MFYGIPTGWAHEELDRCLNSIKTHDPNYEIVLINNNSENHLVRDVLSKYLDTKCWVVHEDRNIGVGAAWNKLCKIAWYEGYEQAIILNDDIYFTTNRYLTSFRGRSDLAVCDHTHYACFCISKKIYEQVGEFDEANYAYFEDNDFNYRCKLAGASVNLCPTDAIHGDGTNGSTTIRKSVEMRYMNDRCFPVAREYYMTKWGGLPGNETYTEAFNGGPARSGSIESWKLELKCF